MSQTSFFSRRQVHEDWLDALGPFRSGIRCIHIPRFSFLIVIMRLATLRNNRVTTLERAPHRLFSYRRYCVLCSCDYVL
jgi:hypothetical protein